MNKRNTQETVFQTSQNVPSAPPGAGVKLWERESGSLSSWCLESGFPCISSFFLRGGGLDCESHSPVRELRLTALTASV